MAAEPSSSRAETSGTDGRFFKPPLHIERPLPISSIRLRYGDESGTSRPRPAPFDEVDATTELRRSDPAESARRAKAARNLFYARLDYQSAASRAIRKKDRLRPT